VDLHNLQSFLGLGVLMVFAWTLSTDRRRVNWRVIGWGVGLQMALAFFIFRVPWGARLFLRVNDLAVQVLGAAGEGAKFLFGRLALPPFTEDPELGSSLGFFLAFQALPSIIFFSALMSILYYLNIMPRLIRAFAWVFTRLMRVSGAEALVAASNIFVGIESALTVRPHLARMTRSELCTVLSVGMATVASNVLALYVAVLQPQFPTIAGHLISASLLSAPAALIMAKLLLPEGEHPETLGRHIEPHYERDRSLFEAVINGANNGLRAVLGIAAVLVAVLGLVALANLCLGALGREVGSWFGAEWRWSLEGLAGWIFYPFTLVMGVPIEDAGRIATIVGERAIVTEVKAYKDLALAIGEGLRHERSAVVAAYALCGFAHVASMAIFVGGISALAPERTHALAKVAFRALLAATLACLMTACVAGTFYAEGSILFSG